MTTRKIVDFFKPNPKKQKVNVNNENCSSEASTTISIVDQDKNEDAIGIKEDDHDHPSTFSSDKEVSRLVGLGSDFDEATVSYEDSDYTNGCEHPVCQFVGLFNKRLNLKQKIHGLLKPSVGFGNPSMQIMFRQKCVNEMIPFVHVKKRKLNSSNRLLFSDTFNNSNNLFDLKELYKSQLCHFCGTYLNFTSSRHLIELISSKKAIAEPKSKSNLNVTPSYCGICDVSLSSSTNAQQHFNGKRHKCALMKHSNQTGIEYSSVPGMNVKVDLELSDNKVMTSEDSSKSKASVVNGEKNCCAIDSNETVKAHQTAKSNSSITCTVCNVTIPSSLHMDTHVRGAKHLKKLKNFESQILKDETRISSKSKEAAAPIDLSLYQKVSRSYHCEICDVNITDEASFRAHLLIEKHIKTPSDEV